MGLFVVISGDFTASAWPSVCSTVLALLPLGASHLKDTPRTDRAAGGALGSDGAGGAGSMGCSEVTALSEGLSALTALQTLDFTGCSKLQELPLWLADLTALKVLDLEDCPALHTPPPHVVCAGTAAVQQFLHDLRKRSAPCHLVKVVLLGDQCMVELPEKMRRCAVLEWVETVQQEAPGAVMGTRRLRKCATARGCRVPEGLSALTALQTLNLYRCRGLTGLPEGLSALTVLQTLDLFWCFFFTEGRFP
jgi:hypothetical protein